MFSEKFKFSRQFLEISRRDHQHRIDDSEGLFKGSSSASDIINSSIIASYRERD